MLLNRAHFPLKTFFLAPPGYGVAGSTSHKTHLKYFQDSALTQRQRKCLAGPTSACIQYFKPSLSLEADLQEIMLPDEAFFFAEFLQRKNFFFPVPQGFHSRAPIFDFESSSAELSGVIVNWNSSQGG